MILFVSRRKPCSSWIACAIILFLSIASTHAQIGDQCACIASATTFTIRDLTQSCPGNNGGPGLPNLANRGIETFNCNESDNDDTAVVITKITFIERNTEGDNINEQTFTGQFFVGKTFEFESITNKFSEYPIASVDKLPAGLEVLAIGEDADGNELSQGWFLDLIPNDLCTVQPFEVDDYIGWIGWAALQNPKRYLCPEFGDDVIPVGSPSPVASPSTVASPSSDITQACRWDGFRNGGECSNYNNLLGEGGDCMFDAQKAKLFGKSCQNTSQKECRTDSVRDVKGCYWSCKKFHRKCCCPAKVLPPTSAPTVSLSPISLPPTSVPTATCPYLNFKRSSSCRSYKPVLNGDCMFDGRDGKLRTTCASVARDGCDINRIRNVNGCYRTCRMFHERCCCSLTKVVRLGGKL